MNESSGLTNKVKPRTHKCVRTFPRTGRELMIDDRGVVIGEDYSCAATVVLVHAGWSVCMSFALFLITSATMFFATLIVERGLTPRDVSTEIVAFGIGPTEGRIRV